MSITYATYQTQIATLIAASTSDPNFVAILPGAIDYAEQRIYRELDLLNTTVRTPTGTLTASNRNFTLPTPSAGPFVTVQEINVITPVSTAPDSGTRNQLTATTKEFLDAVWNSATGATVPKWFAPIDQLSIIVGPWPDAAYTVEVVGTVRPAPLSATNTTTFLTNYLPDLFIAASMVYFSGYMRNFGSQSDDPKMSASWESQYQTLFASAKGEELRKKFAGSDWTAYSIPIGKPI